MMHGTKSVYGAIFIVASHQAEVWHALVLLQCYLGIRAPTDGIGIHRTLPHVVRLRRPPEVVHISVSPSDLSGWVGARSNINKASQI